MNFTFAAAVAFALTAVCVVSVLRQYRPEFSVAVSVIAAGGLLLFGVVKSGEIISAVRSMASRAGVDEQNILIIIKALGVCYLAQLGRDICCDCGQTALGDKVDFIGKVTLALMSLPIITQVLELISKMLGS